MPKNAIKFIRDVESEALLRIQKAEKEIGLSIKAAEEEAAKRRESEIFKLKKELEALEASEMKRAESEAEKIEKDTESEMARIRQMQIRNREKAVEFVISSLFEGD